MHSFGIVHQGLDPKNITFDSEGHLVVSDFSHADLSYSTETLHTVADKNQCIMAEYMAPELLLGWVRNCAADCWSFGMLVYFMLFGAVRRHNAEPMSLAVTESLCSIHLRRRVEEKTSGGYTIRLSVLQFLRNHSV